jgi:DNA-binding NarL/FixJ family response regulator
VPFNVRDLFTAPAGTTPASSVPADPPQRDRSILLIDDEPLTLEGLRRTLYVARPRWTVQTCLRGEDGLAVAGTTDLDAVICDMSMPGMHGMSVLATMRDEHPGVVRVALSGLVDEQWKARNNEIADVFLAKPCSSEDIIRAVEQPGSFVWQLDAPGNGLSRSAGIDGSAPMAGRSKRSIAAAPAQSAPVLRMLRKGEHEDLHWE